MGHGSWAVAAFLSLAGITSSALAQVEYVRELVGTSGVGTSDIPVLNATQAPIDPSSPYYTNTPNQIILSETTSYSVNSSTGVVSLMYDMPIEFEATPDSIWSFSGQGTTRPVGFLLAGTGQLVTFNFWSGLFQYVPAPYLDVGFISAPSIAASHGPTPTLSLITSGFGTFQHYTVNPATGETTPTAVMSGLDGAEALYQSYGADGLLYILDYGNERMVSFDPTDNFDPIGEFDLQTGITTANVQFAIGVNGNFYLGDGLGGGSTYAADGTYLGSFALPDGVVGDPYTGASYLSADAAGRVYVYDAQTGFHQYQDASVVPEPGTAALLILGGLGAFLLRRRGARA